MPFTLSLFLQHHESSLRIMGLFVRQMNVLSLSYLILFVPLMIWIMEWLGVQQSYQRFSTLFILSTTDKIELWLFISFKSINFNIIILFISTFSVFFFKGTISSTWSISVSWIWKNSFLPQPSWIWRFLFFLFLFSNNIFFLKKISN